MEKDKENSYKRNITMVYKDGKLNVKVEDECTPKMFDPKNIKKEGLDLTKKSVYFLKGCKIPRVKLTVLKEKYNMKVVRDIEKADVIIGHDNINSKYVFNTCVHTLSKSKLKSFFDTHLIIPEENKGYSAFSQLLNESDINEVINIETGLYAYSFIDQWYTSELKLFNKPTHKCTCQSLYSCSSWSALRNTVSYRYNDKYSFLKLTEKEKSDYKYISENNVDNIYDESLLLLEISNSEEKVEIDYETFNTLNDMFNSSDRDNHTLAMEIMSNCNYSKSIVYLASLLHFHAGIIYHNPAKRHVNFMSFAKFMEHNIGTTYYDFQECINILSKNDSLNVQNLELLLKVCNKNEVIPFGYLSNNFVPLLVSFKSEKMNETFYYDTVNKKALTEEQVNKLYEVAPSEEVTEEVI